MNISTEQLQRYIARIETLEAEKAEITAEISENYANAKSEGLDPKIMRKVIALRKKDASERDEEETLLATYLRALGME